MDRSDTPAIHFPVVTKERFAELSGLEVGMVRGMMDRGYLPTVKIGRHRLVNLAELRDRCIDDGGTEPAKVSGSSIEGQGFGKPEQ